jgi:hypothetical protein
MAAAGFAVDERVAAAMVADVAYRQMFPLCDRHLLRQNLLARIHSVASVTF